MGMTSTAEGTIWAKAWRWEIMTLVRMIIIIIFIKDIGLPTFFRIIPTCSLLRLLAFPVSSSQKIAPPNASSLSRSLFNFLHIRGTFLNHPMTLVHNTVLYM